MVIYFKDGAKDYIDPIISLNETESILEIYNGYNNYEFEKKDIEHFDIIEVKDE